MYFILPLKYAAVSISRGALGATGALGLGVLFCLSMWGFGVTEAML